MPISGQTKILLIVVAILVLIYFLYVQNDAPVHNEGSLSSPQYIDQSSRQADDQDTQEQMRLQQELTQIEAGNQQNNQNNDTRSVSLLKETEMLNNNDQGINQFDNEDIRRKFNSKNKSKCGYKRSSYTEGTRGNVEPSDWENYFNKNNDMLQASMQYDNNKFSPVDETNDVYASYRPKKSRKDLREEDLFNVDELLPQEVNQDWFEVVPEPISVKNRHLINVSKPIGINTIGSSLKNPSYDIRGSPPNPKFVVSPWMQSSIEPDTNMKGLC